MLWSSNLSDTCTNKCFVYGYVDGLATAPLPTAHSYMPPTINPKTLYLSWYVDMQSYKSKQLKAKLNNLNYGAEYPNYMRCNDETLRLLLLSINYALFVTS